MNIPPDTQCMPYKEFLKHLRNPDVQVCLVYQLFPGYFATYDVGSEVLESAFSMAEISPENEEKLKEYGVFARYEDLGDGDDKVLYVGSPNE